MQNKEKKQSQFGAVMKRLSRNKMAMFGLVTLIVLIVLAVLAPWISPYQYDAMDFTAMHATPSAEHWFGCDELGRDILSRILYGAKYSLSLGLISVLASNLVGMLFGAIAGYFGGKTDTVIMRLIDVLQAIPGMLLAMVISTVLGPGFGNTILAMSIGGIPMAVRLLRAQILGIRKQEYLEAAEAINCSTPGSF